MSQYGLRAFFFGENMDLAYLVEFVFGVFGTDKYYSYLVPHDDDILGILLKQLPNLTKQLLDEHAGTYHASFLHLLIDRCVKSRLNHLPIYTDIFMGEPVESIALKRSYSIEYVRRIRRNIGVVVASQLIQMENIAEMFSQISVSPRAWKVFDYLSALRLSSREQDVLLTFARQDDGGRSSLARKLHISENTLKVHIRSINEKLGTRTLNEAVLVLRKNMWLS